MVMASITRPFHIGFRRVGSSVSGCKQRIPRCEWLHEQNHRVGLVSRKVMEFRHPARVRVDCNAKAVKDTGEELGEGFINNAALRTVLWSMTGIYVVWLFILPYAPGDPAWAISKETVSMLLNLSLNFFFVLPLANLAGFHAVSAPVLHPTAEALFNIVLGWTLLFGPMLFSDGRNNRFKGSLEALWAGQWLLTNAFLLPYMAIRLNNEVPSTESHSPGNFSRAIVSSAKPIALVGGIIGALSVFWSLNGRPDAGFGSIVDRWDYFLGYVSTDRVAYAFVWDLCLYSLFQTWLIRSNLRKVEGLQMQKLVSILSYVPYVGSVAYLWGLAKEVDEGCI